MARGRAGKQVACAAALAVLVLAAAACSGGSGSGTLATTSGRSGNDTAISSGSALGSGADTGGGAKKHHTTGHGGIASGAPTSRSTTTAPTTTEPASTTTAAATTTTQTTADIGPEMFSSPSRNIGCVVEPDSGARCDIRDRTWSPPPAPPSCQLDYGQGIIVYQGTAALVCAGDTALGPPEGPGDVLAYGSVAQHGEYRCDSEESGMTCTDTRTGHGFFLSNGSYRLF